MKTEGVSVNSIGIVRVAKLSPRMQRNKEAGCRRPLALLLNKSFNVVRNSTSVLFVRETPRFSVHVTEKIAAFIRPNCTHWTILARRAVYLSGLPENLERTARRKRVFHQKRSAHFCSIQRACNQRCITRRNRLLETYSRFAFLQQRMPHPFTFQNVDVSSALGDTCQ